MFFAGARQGEEAGEGDQLQPAVPEGRPEEPVRLPAGAEGGVLQQLPHPRAEDGDRGPQDADADGGGQGLRTNVV